MKKKHLLKQFEIFVSIIETMEQKSSQSSNFFECINVTTKLIRNLIIY